jgi:quinoprotein glucose dehydrogenase
MAAFSRRSALLSSIAMSVAARLPAWAQNPSPLPDTEWRAYAGDLANTRYAPLDQIDAGNFSKLEVAWRFSTEKLGPRPEYIYEGTPLLVKGRMYCTAGSRRDVICLDPATGEQLWLYSLDEGERGRHAPRQYSGHGVSYWSDGKGDDRIVYVTPGYRLVALNAKTGVPVKSFGKDGTVDLKLNDDQPIDPVTGDIGLHATPAIAKNTIVVGAAHLSGAQPPVRANVKGYVRGFDARTGKRKWIFHTIPRKGEFGYDSWVHLGEPEKIGNAGCWAQVSIDPELNLAYLPIELPTGDEVGIYRAGPALFGETLVAVDLDTGKRKWHYQLMHHGLWDRDIPCAPILCDIPHEGRIIKALAQPSKQTVLYVLDRTNGKPVWPIPEVAAPAGDVPNEWYAPTQPLPSKPPIYGVTSVNADTIIDFTPELHEKALKLISHYHTGDIFEPPTLATMDGKWGSLCAPGFQGGTNWPGGCYDPQTHKVFVFAETTVEPGSIVPGDPRFTQFEYVRGTPGTAQVASRAMGAQGAAVGTSGLREGPTSTDGFRPGQTTVDGLPLMKPPYGAISAINLETGDIDWKIAHGDTPDYIKNHPALKGLNIPRTGRPGLLGPMVTRTLVICGEAGIVTTANGQRGAMLRAYDKQTGEEKGAVYMPGPQTGSPMSYMLDGRQYIVLAVGAGAGSPSQLMAFRLPRA